MEEQNSIEQMTVLMVEPGYEPYEKTIPNTLVQKFLNKWTIFLFCSILFSSNQKEH